jgi:hypothetical protein
MPLVFDTPDYVEPITEEDKKTLVKKLMREKRQIEMIKDLLAIAEYNTNILMDEFPSMGGTWNNDRNNGGWE